MAEKSPILNNPYREPDKHYATDPDGQLDYNDVREGRRFFTPEMGGIPSRQKGQKNAFDINDLEQEYGSHMVNLLRKEIKQWRKEGYQGVTRVSKELLDFWFNNPERSDIRKLFFAQQEAVETAIYLNEVAGRSNPGNNILEKLRAAQQDVSDDPLNQLPRIAFKMATGTGKTVVMACLLVYHFFNRQQYPGDTRFADYFLIVAPSITIRERLKVLFVDKEAGSKRERKDYYAERDLVPRKMEKQLDQLNARLKITNYHSFLLRNLQGNKRSPMDGKLDEDGNKQEAKEAPGQMVKRVTEGFRPGKRLLVINDEAHHCYLPKAKGKQRTKDHEEYDENQRAAVWFTGLTHLARYYKLSRVYDLSATPYYLQGSGYEPYTLFGWVASDFGLIEAIESGLVKIPFLPERDTSHELDVPKLRNLYDHVKEKLPSKGQKKKKSEARKAGETVNQDQPNIPELVELALDQFYNHYRDYFEGHRDKQEANPDLFTTPPVFIVVCNNTSVSKDIHRYIAGYPITDENGETVRVVGGRYDLFSNYDEATNKPKTKAPTLLIDSEALDDAGQINSEFKKVYSREIAEYKREYARQYGQGEADRLTDEDLMREVVNTVGKPDTLGGHIRCVVSVSMLTEGWDANTVTHVMGLRAFNSQLLCEQVAGRALRRRNYILQKYDKDGNPTDDDRKAVEQKFPPEYAHIIGVPFNMFKGGQSAEPPNMDYTSIFAVPDRENDYEITFPNLEGYRLDFAQETINYDFSDVEHFEIDGTQLPLETLLASPISQHEEKIKAKSVLEYRDQFIIYELTRALIRQKYSDDDENRMFHLFGQLKEVVEHWYYNRIRLLNYEDDRCRKLIYFFNPKEVAEHINRGINPEQNREEFVRPVFMNPTEKFGSTKYVSGYSTKEVYETSKSHVNYVVSDAGWEQIAAKTLEEMDEVDSYVKNEFLGFRIPYIKEGEEKFYVPDFIARCTTSEGITINLVIEITGFNKEKDEKKWYVNNRWLPAVNSVRDKYGYEPWHFVEIAEDIRNIKNELRDKIKSVTQNVVEADSVS